MKKIQSIAVLGSAILGIGGVLYWTAYTEAAAPSQTAQSAMVATTYDSTAYVIEPTVTWSYDKSGCAVNYYQANAGVWNGVAPTCTGGGRGGANCLAGNQPGTPVAPAVPVTGPNSVSNHAQDDRCIFFSGGAVPGFGYDQPTTVNGLNGGGNWTFNYNYATSGTAAVDADTCWNAGASGSTTVDVGFSGFVSSESFLLQTSKTKYSFTLLENNVTRVRGVSAQLESSPDGLIWTPVVGALADLNNTDTDGDLTNDALAASATGADYSYYGTGGVFGKAGVFGSLHAPGYLPANGVNAILTSDSFPNNDKDLASGNVHQANYGGTWSGVAGDPNGGTLFYRTVISGTIKGNGGSGSEQFNVGSIPVIIGGC